MRLWIALALGCGGMAGADGGTDAGPLTEECGPDLECPASMPSQGAACEGALSCNYVEENEAQWRFDCAGGGWTAQNTYCPHDGICVPPFAQACASPSTDPIDATIELGIPLGGFAPFTSDQPVPMVIGPQGGTMVQLRLRVNAETPPRCIELESTLTTNGVEGLPVTQPIALSCGLSQPFFLLLPVACGEAPEHDVTIRARVTGAGETSATLRITGGDGPCPRG